MYSSEFKLENANFKCMLNMNCWPLLRFPIFSISNILENNTSRPVHLSVQIQDCFYLKLKPDFSNLFKSIEESARAKSNGVLFVMVVNSRQRYPDIRIVQAKK